MSTPDTSQDAAIILQLTRENARLKLAHDLCLGELDSICQTLQKLGIGARPDDDPTSFESYTASERVQLLYQRIKAFPLVLDNRYHQLDGEVFEVTFPTSIEPVIDYVIAADKQAVERWLAAHPGNRPGRDITIKAITGFSPGRVYFITRPEGACCENERRNLNGGCDNCGDPCL